MSKKIKKIFRKRCYRCKKTKLLKEFSPDEAVKDGFSPSCRKCQSVYDKKKYLKNKKNPIWRENVRKASHAAKIKHYFNLTIAKYDEMVELQDGVCAICGKIELSGRRLSVDHDHSTGTIRQLLCRRCNMGIGQFSEDTQLLKQAIKYLEKHKHK